MFALDEELARCEAALPLLSGLPRLTLLVTMAWHLRQRDSARALQLCADARPLMTELSDAAQNAINARFELVAAEAEWLAGRLEQAQMLANGALARFAAVGDNASCAGPSISPPISVTRSPASMRMTWRSNGCSAGWTWRGRPAGR
jgi:hypothetical protein